MIIRYQDCNIKKILQDNSIGNINELLERFLNYFGVKTNVLVAIDPASSRPYYDIDNKIIFLSIKNNEKDYCRITCQLSHEIIHHLVCDLTDSSIKISKINKFNEIFACAFTLYFIKKIMNWHNYYLISIRQVKSSNFIYSEFSKEILRLSRQMSKNIGITRKIINKCIIELKNN